MKIALFGGSFNPIHLGHLLAAQQVLEKTPCKEVWFLPCYQNPLKKKKPVLAGHRLAMLKLAAREAKGFKVKEFELKKIKPSHSIETVRELKKRFSQHEFYWVIGSNLVKEVPKWFKAKEFLKETRLIVVKMFDFRAFAPGEKRLLKKNHSIIVKPDAMNSVTSSLVRKKLKQKKQVSFLVSEPVEHYIKKRGLYS